MYGHPERPQSAGCGRRESKDLRLLLLLLLLSACERRGKGGQDSMPLAEFIAKAKALVANQSTEL